MKFRLCNQCGLFIITNFKLKQPTPTPNSNTKERFVTINWSAVRDETASILQGLIRFDTVSRMGNETRCCAYAAEVLKRDGIDSVILEAEPTSGNLVARLKGNGSQRPFLMFGHIDVVPVEREKWTVEPFGGEIKEGWLYGRGALDMKNIDAIQMMVMILLKREGVELNRDVILMLNADEEVGGRFGARWMVENHPELISAEVSVTELGGNAFEFAGKKFFMVQTGEKGGQGFYLRARGKPGHGSMPGEDNAILKLARAIQKIGATARPIHVSPTMRQYVETIAREAGPDGEIWYGLLDAKTFEETLEALPVSWSMKKMLHSQFHNSLSPNILKAGAKVNVIPGEAEVYIDCRKVPGQTREEVVREVRAVIGDDPALEIDFRGDLNSTGVEQLDATQHPFWQLMAKHIQANVPEGVLLPFLHTVGTDGRFQVNLGTKVYGFTPALSPMAEYDRIHGHDERIALSDIEFGVRVLYDVVKEYCAA
jgi:acetylornithine deacetylase/succinyl-diaminopimelate desuccinylase-like protein